MRDRATKVSYLDGIRGLAALLVLVHHVFLAFLPAVYYPEPMYVHWRPGWEAGYGRSIFSALTNGSFNVCIFFVLSGYVLSRQYFLHRRAETLISAASRRFIRLYIPVAATLVIAYALLKAGLFYNVPASRVALTETWLGTFWITDNPEGKLFSGLAYSTMFTGDGFLDFSLWSISVELFGSMLVFAFLALTHDTRNRALALFALLVYFACMQQYYYDAFLAGIALHFTKRWELQSPFWRVILSTLLLAVSLGLGSAPMGPALWLSPAWKQPEAVTGYHVLGSVGVIISVLMSPRLQRFFSLRPMRFLGYISYCLYLLHALVLGSLASFIVLRLYRFGYMRTVGLALIATVAVTVIAAYLMTRFVDDKGVQLSKYVYRRWFCKTTAIRTQTDWPKPES